MGLNFAVLLKFLNTQNIQGQEIAGWLNTSPENISRIKNNKTNMLRRITQEEFYKEIFDKNDFLTRSQTIDDLYIFLESRNCISENIAQGYEKYKKQYRENCPTEQKIF